MRNPVLVISVLSLLVAGCASKPESVAASYASPVLYQGLNCTQLGAEAQRVSGRVQELSGMQNRKAGSDALMTGVALVVFWPAAFMIKGDDQTTAELARLKGEMDAIEQASISKKCGIKFDRPAAK